MNQRRIIPCAVILGLLVSVLALADANEGATLDAVTAGLRQYRASWSADNTTELLQRSRETGKRRFSLKTDDGATVVVQVQDDGRVLVDGVDLLETGASADRPQLAAPRLIYVVGTLSILLCLSLALNVALIVHRRDNRTARATDVIRHLGRF